MNKFVRIIILFRMRQIVGVKITRAKNEKPPVNAGPKPSTTSDLSAAREKKGKGYIFDMMVVHGLVKITTAAKLHNHPLSFL